MSTRTRVIAVSASYLSRNQRSNRVTTQRNATTNRLVHSAWPILSGTSETLQKSHPESFLTAFGLDADGAPPPTEPSSNCDKGIQPFIPGVQ